METVRSYAKAVMDKMSCKRLNKINVQDMTAVAPPLGNNATAPTPIDTPPAVEGPFELEQDLPEPSVVITVAAPSSPRPASVSPVADSQDEFYK